ncbi:Gfo/Idh/MocA family protein [Arthrobacter sunyaminii]|uniref:Gfo/Idh/MocA family oxidoreductase n=1 Tax=Arthrobacter sunyaminii TaxID=2816859 RepID=A0A975S834_9MICC|nr:Gfo/Idh/MocA family oxidoreductase [Arthrobacter sunyaminii]MBO0895116.1 Gfo/Idh/MocA family oxidoreductase [Arthrobacter sunyaminii]MBO0906790.1 Gfo/Idh/MocA family oxidoreductase [Arthrobacter sunyaminii]QWQ37558.1 Gfo/Idh/MocA family oxidoreductase [Arthrobacter sunyaminii]
MSAAPAPIRVAVVGAGYWGPNLARNFKSCSDFQLTAICDLDLARAQRVAEPLGNVAAITSLPALLASDIEAIAVATPAQTHHGIAMEALRMGKHVLVEKPLADSLDKASQMVDEAALSSLVLMTDHTYCYTPAVAKIRELVIGGHLGDLLFIDCTRINLGLVQPDVDVFWDLAPHDLSILDFILPDGLHPVRVSAHGADPLGTGKSCIGHLMMPLPNGVMAHVQVNWLSPTKTRQVVVGGSEKTLVWDDLNPQQRLSIYDRGVRLNEGAVVAGDAQRTAAQVSYRLGDTWSPALPEREALADMVTEFAAAIRGRRRALTDGSAGLRVLSVLEAASRSLRNFGRMERPESSSHLLKGRL